VGSQYFPPCVHQFAQREPGWAPGWERTEGRNDELSPNSGNPSDSPRHSGPAACEQQRRRGHAHAATESHPFLAKLLESAEDPKGFALPNSAVTISTISFVAVRRRLSFVGGHLWILAKKYTSPFVLHRPRSMHPGTTGSSKKVLVFFFKTPCLAIQGPRNIRR